MSEIGPSDRWALRISKLQFDKIKTEEGFWGVVALARAVNALRFVHSPLEHYQNDSPGALRVRYNSFFFNCALFYEADLLVQKLHQYHGGLPEFQALAAVMTSKPALALRDGSLNPLRNKFVFHFDIDATGTQLTNLSQADPIFISGMGGTNQQTYYELPDICAISTFLGSVSLDDAAIQGMVKMAADLTLQFLEKAELFLFARLEKSGWKVVPADEASLLTETPGPEKVP